MNEKKVIKKNAEDAKMISLDLRNGDEIKTKVEYYKSILKAYDDLSVATQDKIDIIDATHSPSASDRYDRAKLVIEKLESQNAISEKKRFFEMWLARELEYDKKFAIVTKECNDNFDSVVAQATVLAEKDMKLKSYMTKFEMEENVSQKTKNEYYLLLKFEVGKANKFSSAVAFN